MPVTMTADENAAVSDTAQIAPPMHYSSRLASPSYYALGSAESANQSCLESSGEEGVRKREMRLLKNREAARECRRKKKEYIKCLENRVAVLENQNKALIEELKTLKEELYAVGKHHEAKKSNQL